MYCQEVPEEPEKPSSFSDGDSWSSEDCATDRLQVAMTFKLTIVGGGRLGIVDPE
jgi:hypothetical protein